MAHDAGAFRLDVGVFPIQHMTFAAETRYQDGMLSLVRAALLAAIRKVVAGGKYIDPALMDSLAVSFSRTQREPHDALSAREMQVLRLIIAGHQIADIAVQLHLSPKTVSTHKMRIMQKLNVANNAELMRYAFQHALG